MKKWTAAVKTVSKDALRAPSRPEPDPLVLAERDFPSAPQQPAPAPSSAKGPSGMGLDVDVFTRVHGVRTAKIRRTVPRVRSLLELCQDSLIRHVGCIQYVGEVPVHLLQPVLESCSAEQLQRIESYKPIFEDQTQLLWRKVGMGKRKYVCIMCFYCMRIYMSRVESS